MHLSLLSALFLLTSALPLPSQSIELRSGEVVIGRVVEVGERSVKIEVDFPAPTSRTIERTDIEPRSIYAVLTAHIDAKDGRAHIELAAECRQLGLFAYAIAEAREAARRDPALAATANTVIAEVRAAIAADLLRQAETALAEDRAGSARLAAQVVLRDYRDTAAAEGAQDVLRRLGARSGAVAREASVAEITKAIESARAVLDRTAKDTEVPAHGTMRDQRSLRRAIGQIEKTWESIGELAVSGEDATVTDRLSSIQAEVRKRLVDSYLALGSIYLQRRALPDADEWCNKACELDPDNQHLHRLHELILHAKLVTGWRY